MAATPNALDYFNRNEPFADMSGSSSTTGFDYFNRGEPIGTVVVASALAARPRIVLQALNRAAVF